MFKRICVSVSMGLVAATLVLTCGCRRGADSTSGAHGPDQALIEQELRQAMEASYQQANELFSNGQTNEAVLVFDALLENHRYAPWADRIFFEAIRIRLFAGHTDPVRDRVLAACTNGPVACARVGLQLLLPYLTDKEGSAAAFAFASSVASLPRVDAELVRQATEWRFFTALGLPDREQTTDALSVILAAFPADAADAALARAFEQLLAASRWEDLEAIHAQATAAAGGRESRKHLLLTCSVRMAAGRAQWDAARDLFKTAAAALPDAALQNLMSQILPAARSVGRFDVVDACAEEVIFRQGGKTATVSQAARLWTESAMATNRAALPQRLAALLDAKIPPPVVSPLLTRFFYDLIDETAVLKQLLPIANQLLVGADEETVKMIKSMRLDGAFVLEDYDLAESYLEAGVPGRNAAWHTMARCKVKAHRALKNNKPREAVEQFRLFMACLGDLAEAETYDPTTGIQHTPDMLRGRNALRIAEILAGIPDADAAAAARVEAASYYKKALESVTAAESRDIIRKEAGNLLD
jgi:hypothetical protein